MLVPVLNVNPGICNYEDFSASFCTVIQDDLDEPNPQMTLNYDELQSNEGVALNLTDSCKCLHAMLDTEKLIKKNDDLELKLLNLSKDLNLMRTSSTLSNDQAELLRIHERYNHVLSIADIQLLAASGKFPSRLSKCTRPVCATCCYG